MYSLFPGFNSTAIDGDDMDGSGINFSFWPVLFDSFEPLQPMILTPQEMDVFDGCADLVIQCENRTWTLPTEVREIQIRRVG